MSTNYWSADLNKRVRRRRALAATGLAGAGAALLAAWGGGASSDDPGSGLLGVREDSSGKAVPGGTLVDVINGETYNLDIITSASAADQGQLLYNYSNLVKSGMNTTSLRPGLDEIEGDAADKWEISPDLTQVTFKIRPNHKFDPRPPTNGRAMTSEDVKWSWDKYVKSGPSAGDVAN